MGKTPYDVEFYDDIRKQNPAVTDGLIKVLNKATAQNPANRYQSAADFKYALQHYHDRDEAVIRIRQRKLNAFRGLIAAAISFFMIGCDFDAAFVCGTQSRLSGQIKQRQV